MDTNSVGGGFVFIFMTVHIHVCDVPDLDTDSGSGIIFKHGHESKTSGMIFIKHFVYCILVLN